MDEAWLRFTGPQVEPGEWISAREPGIYLVLPEADVKEIQGVTKLSALVDHKGALERVVESSLTGERLFASSAKLIAKVELKNHIEAEVENSWLKRM